MRLVRRTRQKKSRALSGRQRDNSWLQCDNGHWIMGCEECDVTSKATYCVIGYAEGGAPIWIKSVCHSCSQDYLVLEKLEW